MRLGVVEERANQAFIILPEGQAAPVTANGKPVCIAADWSVDRLLILSDSLSVITFRHRDGLSGGWLLDAQFRRLGDLAKLTKACPAEVRQEFTSILLPIFLDLLEDSLSERAQTALFVLAELSPELRMNLVAFVECLMVESQTASAQSEGSDEPVKKPSQNDVQWKDALDLRARMSDFVSVLVNPNVSISSSTNPLIMLESRLLPVSEIPLVEVLLCWVERQQRPFLYFFRKIGSRRRGFIYRPDDRSAAAQDGRNLPHDDTTYAIHCFYWTLLELTLQNGTGHLRKFECGGLILSGVRNFGHGLWDELQALDRAIAREAARRNCI
jgi:hypothetical protein